MKPLTNIDEFLKRFNSFIDSEIRFVKPISATTILVSITAQDGARDFDWITIDFEFSGVVDAKLIEDSKLSFINMEDGITIACNEDRFGFGVGKYLSQAGIKNSLFYIECLNIKYKEGLF